jgi:hypothetical protein
VVAEGAVGFVVFAGEPEDVVVVEDAPDGGEEEMGSGVFSDVNDLK